MAATGENQRPPMGHSDGRLWGESHGHRHGARRRAWGRSGSGGLAESVEATGRSTHGLRSEINLWFNPRADDNGPPEADHGAYDHY